MGYTNFNTYKIPAKYIKKIYEMKKNEIDYLKIRSYVSWLKFMKVFLIKKKMS